MSYGKWIRHTQLVQILVARSHDLFASIGGMTSVKVWGKILCISILRLSPSSLSVAANTIDTTGMVRLLHTQTRQTPEQFRHFAHAWIFLSPLQNRKQDSGMHVLPAVSEVRR